MKPWVIICLDTMTSYPITNSCINYFVVITDSSSLWTREALTPECRSNDCNYYRESSTLQREFQGRSGQTTEPSSWTSCGKMPVPVGKPTTGLHAVSTLQQTPPSGDTKNLNRASGLNYKTATKTEILPVLSLLSLRNQKNEAT